MQPTNRTLFIIITRTWLIIRTRTHETTKDVRFIYVFLELLTLIILLLLNSWLSKFLSVADEVTAFFDGGGGTRFWKH